MNTNNKIFHYKSKYVTQTELHKLKGKALDYEEDDCELKINPFFLK